MTGIRPRARLADMVSPTSDLAVRNWLRKILKNVTHCSPSKCIGCCARPRSAVFSNGVQFFFQPVPVPVFARDVLCGPQWFPTLGRFGRCPRHIQLAADSDAEDAFASLWGPESSSVEENLPDIIKALRTEPALLRFSKRM